MKKFDEEKEMNQEEDFWKTPDDFEEIDLNQEEEEEKEIFVEKKASSEVISSREESWEEFEYATDFTNDLDDETYGTEEVSSSKEEIEEKETEEKEETTFFKEAVIDDFAEISLEDTIALPIIDLDEETLGDSEKEQEEPLEENPEEEEIEELSEEDLEDLSMEEDSGETSQEELEEEYSEEEYSEEELEEEYPEEEYPEEENLEEEQDKTVIFTPVGDRKGKKDKEDDLEMIESMDDEDDEEEDMFSTILGKAVIVAGGIVAVLLVVCGGLLISKKLDNAVTVDTSSVGAQLKGVDVIGQKGMDAISLLYKEKLQASLVVADPEQTPQPEATEEPLGEDGYEENEYNKTVSVKMNTTSIEKDLKIKFLNKESGKLVGSVPFSVTVVDPSGNNITWTDDDMDGIIYKKGIVSGTYQIMINAFEDEKYLSYKCPVTVVSVDVKDKIKYEKIDNADEIKTEDQINVKEEDTAKNETVVESYNPDTVEWVETASVPADYVEISKDQVVNPVKRVQSAAIETALYIAGTEPAEPTVAPEATSEATQEATQTPEATAQATPTQTAEVTPEATQEATVTPEATQEATVSPEATPTAAPEATPTVSPEATPTVTEAPTEAPTATEAPTEAPVPTAPPLESYEVHADPRDMTLKLGESKSVLVVGKDVSFTSITWSSANAEAVSVDNTGKVTALKAAGTPVTLSFTASGKDSAGREVGPFTGNCQVTVQADATLSLSASTTEVVMENSVSVNINTANTTTTGVLSVESANKEIADGKIEGNVLKVTGIGEGKTTLTVKYTDGEKVLSATCEVTVKFCVGDDPRVDETTPLKDTEGNELYVLDNGNYREAHYADYFKFDKFYKKGNVKYTGWQTIDGQLRYYDKDGNRVYGKQTIQGAEYDFGDEGFIKKSEGIIGIDVSKWNGEIDWNAVKNSGVSYVIIRCGYRGSTKGALIEDPKFRSNVKGATEAGLNVGVYFFTQAVDRVEAVEEASMVLNMVSGYKITYPIFLDVEASGGRADGISKQARTEVCQAFCETIKSGGYTAGVYANKTWFTEKIDASALSGYKIWLAQYAAKPTYNGRYDIWQYKESGTVAGIKGNVDFNLSYLGY